MTKTLNELHQDHINISRLMDLLEKQAGLLEKGKPGDLQLITAIIEYIKNYPDLYHHPREDLIFELLRHKDKEIEPVIDRLLDEHKSLAELASRLTFKLAELRGKRSKKSLAKQLRNYIGLTRSHMNIEETELFPRAKEILTEDDWKEIEAGFTFENDPLFGNVIYKQYKHIYDSIIK